MQTAYLTKTKKKRAPSLTLLESTMRVPDMYAPFAKVSSRSSSNSSSNSSSSSSSSTADLRTGESLPLQPAQERSGEASAQSQDEGLKYKV